MPSSRSVRNIPPRRRMLPHAHIHGRRCEHALVGGEQHGGGKIVGQAMRHLGEEVGGRRRHDDEVGLARQPDMPDLGFVLEVEEIGEGFFLGEHGERQRRDEFGAAACQDRAHARAPLLQAAHEIEALIGGDAAADDQAGCACLARSLTPLSCPRRRASSNVTYHSGLLDCRVKPGNDENLGYCVLNQNSSARAMAASAMAATQMPMRLERFFRLCASASRSTV